MSSTFSVAVPGFGAREDIEESRLEDLQGKVENVDWLIYKEEEFKVSMQVMY